MALTPISGLWVAYAIVALGLVPLVLKARPITKGNLILVVLLLQQAWQQAAFVLAVAVSDPLVRSYAFLAAAAAVLLWSPLLWLAGPLMLGNGREAKLVRNVGIAGAAPSLVMVLAFFLQPTWVIRADQGGFTPLAGSLVYLVFLGFAFSVAVFAREALTTPMPVRRGQFALLACAFSVEGAYHAAQNAAQVALAIDGDGGGFGPLLVVLRILPLLAFGGVAAWALRVAMTDADPTRRRWGRIIAAFLGASAATGFAAAPLSAVNEFTQPFGAFHALWDLAALALIIYSGLRYQLFSLELRAKQGLAVTAALVLGFVTFQTLQQLAQELVQNYVIGGLPAPGILAALVVGAISLPIVKASQSVSRRVFPNVHKGMDYEQDRRVKIYLAALEGAFADGIATPKEAAFLKRLRAELQIEEAEHDRLEVQVRQELARPVAAVAA